MVRFIFFALMIAVALFLPGCSDESGAPVEPSVSGESSTNAVSPTLGLTARVNITFKELGSPGQFDNFVVTNLSDQGIRITSLTIYLQTASNDVIIDMLPGPPGVGEGSWMYTLDEMQCGMYEWRGLLEGGKRIVLKWWNFEPGKWFRFGVDLDRQYLDLGTWSEDITGGEIAGTTVLVNMVGPTGVGFQLTSQLNGLNSSEAGIMIQKAM